MGGMKRISLYLLTLSFVALSAAGCKSSTAIVPPDGAAVYDDAGPDIGLPKQDQDVFYADMPVPDRGIPDAPLPDMVQPDITPLDGPQPDMIGPDMMQPDQYVPDMMQPDQYVPDMMPDDQYIPDMLQPDQYVPDMLQPDTYLPPVGCSITYPSRAAMLNGSAAITIKGKLTGPLSSLDYVQVNGKKVNPLPNGEFSLPAVSGWGLNIITVDCVDKNSNVDHRVQAYHYSTKYWPFSSSASSMKVLAGALARLYQKAIDDNNRATLNDMASILEKVINALNFDKLIPSTLVSGKYKIPPWGPTISYSVTKSGTFKVNPFKIWLKARTGGVKVTGSTSYLELPVKAKAGASVSGKVKIYNLSMTGDINISKKSGGATSVSVPSLKMNYSSLKVELGSGIIGSIMSSITSGIASLFKSSIIGKMEAEVKKAIPGPMKSFVTGFKFAQSFKLPAELGGATLGIYTDLDTIAFDNYGGNLGLNSAVYGTKGITSGKLGTISAAASYSPPATGTDAMLVGVRYDTLNQALGSTWYTGALKQDLSSLVKGALNPSSLPFSLSGLKLKVEALLPPILIPGKGTNDFKIGVGDLKLTVEASVTDSGGKPSVIKADAHVSAATTGTISLSSKNVLSLSLSTQLSEYDVEIDNLVILGTNTGLGGAFAVLVKEMVKVLLPKLGPNILQSFPLPAIDLSALGGSYGIPKGTVLKIKNGKLFQKGNYVVLSGELG